MGKGSPGGPPGGHPMCYHKCRPNVRIVGLFKVCVLRRKGKIKKEEIKEEMFAKEEYTLNSIKFFIFL